MHLELLKRSKERFQCFQNLRFDYCRKHALKPQKKGFEGVLQYDDI